MAEHSYNFVIEEEKIFNQWGNMIAESNRAEIACSLASQGCQGVDATYWW